MATARSARAPAARSRRSSPPRPAPRLVAGGATGIRWDRLSRVALLVVLAVLLFLYVNPARSYWSTMQEAKHRREQVATLKRENERLRARRSALGSPSALEREARRMGMVRSGERPFVVRGLPRGR